MQNSVEKPDPAVQHEGGDQLSRFESAKNFITQKLSEGGHKTKELLEKHPDLVGAAGLALLVGGVYTFNKAGVEAVPHDFATFIVKHPGLLWASVGEALVGVQGVALSFDKGHEDGSW